MNRTDCTTIAQLREAIDRLDGELVSLLERRMELVRRIGRLKSESQTPIVQPDRFAEVLARAKQNAVTISPDAIEALFEAIHKESINQQEKI